MAIPAQTMTLDEFLAQYEDDPVLEFADGVVTEKMAPSWPHSGVATVVSEQINLYARPRKLAYAFVELRTTDTRTGISRVPDIAVFRWERIERPILTRRRGAQTPPDIAIEVASPGQSRQKQIERCHAFLAAGARIGLMIDPPAGTIVDVRPGQPVRRLRGDDVLDLSEVIPGLAFVVSALFAAMDFE